MHIYLHRSHMLGSKQAFFKTRGCLVPASWLYHFFMCLSSLVSRSAKYGLCIAKSCRFIFFNIFISGVFFLISFSFIFFFSPYSWSSILISFPATFLGSERYVNSVFSFYFFLLFFFVEYSSLLHIPPFFRQPLFSSISFSGLSLYLLTFLCVSWRSPFGSWIMYVLSPPIF